MIRRARTREVAEALGLRPTTVQRYARDGQLPFDTTPGGHRLFNVDEVKMVLGTSKTAVRLRPLSKDQGQRGLVTGGAVRWSRTALMERALRSTDTARDADDHAESEQEPRQPALDELMTHARRTAVATLHR